MIVVSPGPMALALSLVMLATPPAPGAAATAPAGLPAGPFASPEQTLEYHLMLNVPALGEADLDSAFRRRVVEPLRGLADVGPLEKRRLCGYVDSPDRALGRRNLIVRVREGQVTVKARASSPVALLDLETCTTKKYEVDAFAHPEYSVSSDLRVPRDSCDAREGMQDLAWLWALVEGRCPALWLQLRPDVAGAAGLRLPGVAHMYDAVARLEDPAAGKVKEAGVTVWFFPPTGRSLVELSFTGHVRDRAELVRLHRKLRAGLRASGLLLADPTSKTEQYFAAYFGKPAERPGRREAGRGAAPARR